MHGVVGEVDVAQVTQTAERVRRYGPKVVVGGGDDGEVGQPGQRPAGDVDEAVVVEGQQGHVEGLELREGLQAGKPRVAVAQPHYDGVVAGRRRVQELVRVLSDLSTT